MTDRLDAVVVGAGVIGLTTAVRLAEAGLSVRIKTAEQPLDTTSAVAAAMLSGPVFAYPDELAAQYQPADLMLRRHETSLSIFSELAARPETGVRVARGRMVSRRAAGDPDWEATLPGHEPCAPEERGGFPVAFWLTIPIVDMSRYLPYLAERFAAAGGSIEQTEVASLDEAAAGAALVVNCAGAGAQRLADDPSVVPARGQQVIVENPGFDGFVFEFTRSPAPVIIMSHGDRLILGTTVERGDWSRETRPEQTPEIIERCAAFDPRIATARVLATQAGLRATRPAIRLEEGTTDGGARVIHHYGHSGVAVGTSWACADEVALLATTAPDRA